MVVFPILETKYFVLGLFLNLVRPFSYLYLWYLAFDCAFCLVSCIARKADMPLPKVIHHIPVSAHQNKLVLTKYSLQIQFYKLIGLWFYYHF